MIIRGGIKERLEISDVLQNGRREIAAGSSLRIVIRGGRRLQRHSNLKNERNLYLTALLELT